MVKIANSNIRYEMFDPSLYKFQQLGYITMPTVTLLLLYIPHARLEYPKVNALGSPMLNYCELIEMRC